MRPRLALTLFVSLVVACSLVTNLTSLQGDGGAADVADVTDAASADVAADASDAAAFDASCTGNAVPKPVPIPGTAACVDSTEVSAFQYSAFVAAFDAAAPVAACTWKTSYAPQQWPTDNTHPITYVDWCDAYAYCAWAGKHLCGTLDGGAVQAASVGDPSVDLWYRACSQNGALAYPYGVTYNPLACRGGDDQDASPQTTVSVGTLPTCAGGYSGLFDMSGNAGEWESSCLPGDAGPQSDRCLSRGGGMHADPTALLCASTQDVIARAYRADWLGIRCCSNQM